MVDVDFNPRTGRRRRGLRHGGAPLPASLTSFVGRTREIAALVARLPETRLLTLTGIGGIGKSRLALEVARAAHGEAAQEACFVELAAVSEPEGVVKAVASGLGVHEASGSPLLDALVTSLSGRDLLLVLDNCEHLVEACADLALTLLRRCPDLRVLATSRIPLDVAGEATWQVEPLATPDLGQLPARAALARYAAVRLFVERARAARAAFALTDANAEDVARVCVRLDGIPLAIELAAALVGVLTPSQLGARLDDRFRLLAGGSRTTLPRHRTLRGLVDWSHDLLAEQERVVFRRLAVFAGGWTLDAAEIVCSDPPTDSEPAPLARSEPALNLPKGQAIERDAVFDVLARLVAASLVRADQSQGETRFCLLETIRAYALEKLREAGEEDQVRHRHLDWVEGLVGQAEPALWTAAQRAWLERLDLELGNVRVALAWSAGSGDVDPGCRIATNLWRYWEQRGLAPEARRWLGSLLDRPVVEPSPVRARALEADAYFAHLTGALAAAEARSKEGLALAHDGDDPITLVFALLTQAIVRGTAGDLATAEAGLNRALAVSQSAGWEPGVWMATVDLGILARIRGDADVAAAHFHHVRALSAAAGDTYAQAFCFTNLAHLALQQGEWAASAGWYRQSLAIWRDFQDVHNVAAILEGLAWPLSAAGRAERAARLFGAAETLRTTAGTTILPHWQADHERAVAAARAALGEERFAAAHAAGRAMTLEQAVAYGLAPDEHGAAASSRPAAAGAALAHGPLSAREADIARLVAQGLTNRQIAEALVLQPSTVGNHLQRIYARLGMNGRAQLAAWVAEHAQPGVPPS